MPSRDRLALPLACGVFAGLLAAVLLTAGPPGIDTPAHLFMTWAFRHAGFRLWNSYWYDGRYDFVGYSLVFYPVASVAGVVATAVGSAAALAAAVAAVGRREWGRAANAPCLALAATATATCCISGAFPFLAGAAAGAVALACAQRRRRIGFGAAMAVSLGCSPLAFGLVAVVLAGYVLGSRNPLGIARRNKLAVAALAATGAACLAIERAFPAGGWYPYEPSDLLVVAAFSGAGLYLTARSPRARGLRMVFAAYLVLNVAAFAVHGPVGSNATRLFTTAGVPLLWLAANVGQRRSWTVLVPVLALALALQLGPAVRNAYSAWSDPATAAPFWRPAVRFLDARRSLQYRTEVVATAGHWEAFYLARRRIALARGWYRQDDFPQNEVLYRPAITGRAYRTWLRRVGVRYVLLPRAPLDYSAHAEARLLRSGRSGLRLVASLPHWTAFALPHPTPILTADEPVPGARVLELGDARVRLWLPAPGGYELRMSFSPYWSTDQRDVCIGPAAAGMTHIETPRAGELTLEFEPTLAAMAAAAAASDTSACAT
ncbi:MAG TPA: hypothetical protein VFX13_08390 [Gaiellales bacterium]|nr:hypothetical protein [Gaiellales bacterium]